MSDTPASEATETSEDLETTSPPAEQPKASAVEVKAEDVEVVDPGLAELPPEVPPEHIATIEIYDREWTIDKRKLVFTQKEEATFRAASAAALKIKDMQSKNLSNDRLEKEAEKHQKELSEAFAREFKYGQRIIAAIIDPVEAQEFADLWGSTPAEDDSSPLGTAVIAWKANNDPKS